MKITSRNVNGIRAVLQKGFLDRFHSDQADILCLQEVKAFENQIPPELKYALRDYKYIWHAGTRPGYSGTAVFFRSSLLSLSQQNIFHECPFFHEDGRTTELRFTYGDKKICLLNIYFPNGGERADGTEMLTSKLQFYTDYLSYINAQKSAGREMITTGDFNICHHPIDIARPEENKNSIGFLPIEREKMDEMERNGYVDVFRYLNPDVADHYTWWSYRAGARPRNVGRRLDYFRVSETILPLVSSLQHQDQIQGSDHCPISLILK